MQIGQRIQRRRYLTRYRRDFERRFPQAVFLTAGEIETRPLLEPGNGLWAHKNRNSRQVIHRGRRVELDHALPQLGDIVPRRFADRRIFQKKIVKAIKSMVKQVQMVSQNFQLVLFSHGYF